MADTRGALLQAALELVADRGARAATTGEIEQRAGLSPRAGGMYRHFASKAELVRTALEERIQGIAEMRAALPSLRLDDLRSELTVLAHAVLAELALQREVTLTLEQHRADYRDLVQRLNDELVQPAFKHAADYLVTRLAVDPQRAEALAVTFLGALVNYRRSQWTLGHAPLDLPEPDLVAGWVDALLAAST